jgi:hypothetical protein
MSNCKLLLKHGPIELWKSWHTRVDRPLFVVKSPDGIYCYPPFCNPNNGRQAIDRVRKLREKYTIKGEPVETGFPEA